jgi:hypothetical protein
MPFYRSDDPGSKNRWRHNVGRATSRRMERTRCPKCKRGGATTNHTDWWDIEQQVSITTCRYQESHGCDYKRVVQITPKYAVLSDNSAPMVEPAAPAGGSDASGARLTENAVPANSREVPASHGPEEGA